MAINTQDVVDTVSDAVTGAQLANTAGNLAGISMPGVFGTLAGPVGYGIKAVTDIYSASPTKPGFFGRLLDRQLMPLRRLGILSTSQADDPFGGYGTEEAEQEGVAGIDTGAGGYAREVTGPVDVTGLTIGGSEFGFDPDPNQRGPDQAQVDANISRSRSLATMDWDESDPDTSTDTDTDTDTGDFQDPDDIDYGHDEEDWADGGHVQKYANGDFVTKVETDPLSKMSLTPKNMTVSELLLLKAKPFELWQTTRLGEDEKSASLTLKDIRSSEDPLMAAIYAAKQPEDSARFNVGGKFSKGPAALEQNVAMVPESQGGKVYTTRGSLGPLRAEYQRQPEAGVQKQTIGFDSGEGPVSFYGSKEDFTQGGYKRRTKNYGARGRIPVGKRGLMKADVAQTRMKELAPGFSKQGKKLNLNLGYEGRGDGSMYGVKAFREQGDNRPRVQGLEGFYEMVNPFGLGGNLNVSGSFVNPEAGKNAAEAMLRYGVRF
jgi:hypothetical protein